MTRSRIVSARIAVPANPGSGLYEFRKEYYTDVEKPWRREIRSLTGEADYWSQGYERDSQDNGRTWGEWRLVRRAPENHGGRLDPKSGTVYYGEMELVPVSQPFGPLWNPVHRHWVHAGT